MAKKRKPAANPARGFATTSVASKPKQEKSAAAKDDAPVARNEDVTIAESATSTDIPESFTNKEAFQPTPEELEAQLLRDELQLLVEKHAPKVRRESHRQGLRLQTDRRVLRTQSEPMAIYEWLSNDAIDRIIALARAESSDSNRRQGQQSLLKAHSEEDMIAKLWMLDLSLRDMGFSSLHIESVLRWLCANAAGVEITPNLWGLQEALEWLALDQCDHSLSFDVFRASRVILPTPGVSPPGTPNPNGSTTTITGGGMHRSDNSKLSTRDPSPTRSSIMDDLHDDVSVSDIESDLEPDELIPTYLKVRGKLFMIDPDAVDANLRNSGKVEKGRNAKLSKAAPSPAIRKLLSQLQQLESDALFDEVEAQALWPAHRNKIAQDIALERKTHSTPSVISESTPETSIRASIPAREKTKLILSPVTQPGSDDENGSLLGDMFSAVTGDESQIIPEEKVEEATNVSLRDFGKQSGLSPRRILEEAVRARDPDARLVYKVISPTVYSCRHSLKISWFKEQNIEYDTAVDGARCITSASQLKVEATTVVTVSVDQSEGFVSTVALFSLCAASPKEEKIYLRLPSNWRDVYKDLLEHRKERIDAGDRDSIQYLRSIVHEQLENEESDGVVLTSQFKMRNMMAASPNSPSSGQITPQQPLDNLRNSWLQKSSTRTYQQMLANRVNLPVFGFRDSILSTIDKHQVVIICGETGCGKSTQIPSFLLEHEMNQGKPCKIFCTEPRRISAISLAQRVSDELGEGPKDLGSLRSLVGYAIRLESKTSAQTRLVFATVGVVLRMLESPRGLDEASHLIIDEVHERSIDTDFLLIILRSLMLTRPDLKVILMSATVDAQRFSAYLNGAPILNVPGRTFPVQTKFLEDAIELTSFNTSPGSHLAADNTSEDDEDSGPKSKSGIPAKLPGYNAATRSFLSTYDEYAIDYGLIVRLMEVVAFHAQLLQYSSAILCFLPGIAEIRQLNDLLVAHPSFDNNWLIYPLHSTISSEEQQAAFLLPPPGMRKIVLATNIAETGVTIPDITCVIDTGKHKEMRFDERRQLSRLTQSFISRANAKQRRGRAGRVQEGLCFHMFTKYRHDNLMAEQQTPEMLRLSLQDLVMRTKICKLGDIEKTLSEALDPPSSRNIRRAIDALIEVDALTSGEDLTPLGRQIAKLPLDAHLGKLVLLASSFSCVDAAITIAAILSSKSPFLTPFGAKQRADAARMTFKKGDSDLLTTYNAYSIWKTVCTTSGQSEAQFCHKNFLSPQNLANIEDLKMQLLSALADAGFVQMSTEERRTLSRYRSTSRYRTFVTVPAQHDQNSHNDILINSVIATAFYPKILIKEGKGWRNLSNNQTVSLAPTSVNKISSVNVSNAKYLSYYHIMQSSNKFYNAHSTSAVQPLPMVLMVGQDVDFKLHAGVINLPGNVLRFAVKEWRVAVALKALRKRVHEILAAGWKNPKRGVSGREKEWLDVFTKMFEDKFEREERIRERNGAKAR